MDFVEQPIAWSRLRAQGVAAPDPAAAECRLDLGDSTEVVVLDVAAGDHPQAAALPAGIRRVARREFGPIAEGIVHKLKLPETVVIPVGRWRDVLEAIAVPMSAHPQWAAVDAAATVKLNTRDPLLLGPAHHHLLRDLVDAVVASGARPAQGVTVAALGVRLLIEVLPGGQMTVFAGDGHLAQPVRAVIDHHSGRR